MIQITPKRKKRLFFFVTCSAPTDEIIHVKIVQTYQITAAEMIDPASSFLQVNFCSGRFGLLLVSNPARDLVKFGV